MKTLKLLAVILALTTTTEIAAQHFERSIDKFTGKETQYTKFETIYRKLGMGEAGEKIDFSFFKIGDSLFLCLSIRMGASKFIAIKENQLLYLKPENGASIVLPAVSSELSKHDRSMSASFILQMYLVPITELNKLRNSSIGAIRIEHSSGNWEFELKNKFSSLFAKVLSEK